MTTPTQAIARLRALLEAATPGEWVRAERAIQLGHPHPDWGTIYARNSADAEHYWPVVNTFKSWLCSPGEEVECRSNTFMDGKWHEPAAVAANAAFIAAAKNAMGPALACIEAASKLSAALYLDQSNISTASRQAYGETFRALASFTAALEGQTNG